MDLKVESEDLDLGPPATLEVFAHGSTLHGISHIFPYERVCARRCLWLTFFLGSLAALLYACADRVHLYLEYPHVTKLDEVATPAMAFPAVTFCNLNSFRFGQVTRNDLYHAGELLALLNQSGPHGQMQSDEVNGFQHASCVLALYAVRRVTPVCLSAGYEIRDVHLVEENVLESLKLKADFHNFKPRPFNMREFYDRTGHDIGDMLLSCHFRGLECRAEDFKVMDEVVKRGKMRKAAGNGQRSVRVEIRPAPAEEPSQRDFSLRETLLDTITNRADQAKEERSWAPCGALTASNRLSLVLQLAARQICLCWSSFSRDLSFLMKPFTL
ncbi:Acid-sensing ion channel 1 [Merluccius polli]|uniref:Acid-sensing ion channel 1 n=1 Tax=Merluccius polli TaxID=89951 RepID=A0AA47M9Z7_MERPO|nr:Acid-sensing ion channel 1 [Merluccius polli]